MSKSGIILVDDYAEISGATEAVDEFFSKKFQNRKNDIL